MSYSLSRIMVVDDHEVIRCSLKIAIKALGQYEIVEAANGRQAIELLKDESCDLIFCDLNMPDYDGMAMMSEMARLGCSTPLVLMSGEEKTLLNSAQALAAKYGLKVLDVVEKPVCASKVEQSIALAAMYSRGTKGQSPRSANLTVKQLREALDAEFVRTYFQPQVSFIDGKVKGVEALARIEHPELGVVSPNEFIDVAENAGLMGRLTMQVVNHAMACMHEWSAAGLNLSLSLNMSASVLEDENLPEKVLLLTQRHNLNPEKVVCELTETIIADDPFAILRNMIRLRIMKFKLSIDDFGTGYASMEQLQEMPLQELKLDRCFVKDCLTNQRCMSIVKSSLQMANEMEMYTVAEGVDSLSVLDALQAMGCTLCQGFLVSPPLPAMEVHPFVTRFESGELSKRLANGTKKKGESVR